MAASSADGPAAPASPRRTALLALALVLSVLLAACAGHDDSGTFPLHVEHATATSATSIDIVFDAPVGDSAEDPDRYAITGSGDDALDVVAAYLRSDGRTVSLATEPQQRETYGLRIHDLTVEGGPAASVETSFLGSEVRAPIVAEAVALDSEHVLVTFLDPDTGTPASMDDLALAAESYEITPSLRIEGAEFHEDGDDRSRVILRTAPQRGEAYAVQATAAAHRKAGGLVDPFNNRASWAGIAPDDRDPPHIVSTFALSSDTVHVSFSEPVNQAAANPANYGIVREGAADEAAADGQETPLAALGATLNEFGTSATLRVAPTEPGAAYSLMASDVRDRSGNLLTTDGEAARFFAANGQGSDNAAPPSVAGVVSTGSTSVVVTFTEPVLGGPASAENASHYRIHDKGAELGAQAVLSVEEAELAEDGTSVTLTTLAQAEILYSIEVANVVDQQGDQIVVQRFASPDTYRFLGTPAAHDPENDGDTDGDGLPDVAEQAGWTVEVRNANGRIDRAQVTSDPTVSDTDGDGVPDDVERRYRTHPRRGDTDADGLTDHQELNEIYSDPADQDSDGDGLEDGLEFNDFQTSPIVADTDGDQIDDHEEIMQANRNPRAADLPRHALEIGDVSVELIVDFEDTTSEGEVQTSTESYETTLTETRANEMSSSSTETMEWYAKASLETEASAAYPGGYSASATFTAEAGVGASGTYVQSQSSRQASEEVYAESLESTDETFRTDTVTRTVSGANLVVPVTLRNVNDISFTMENVEITALIPDPRNPTQLRPIGTLFPPEGSSSVYNLGTIDSRLGPFKFQTRDDDINPDLIETLLANPSAIVLKVSNFDITDELGNQFAYQQQDVTERTAPVVIDFGDGRVERYWAATNTGRSIEIQGDGMFAGDERRVVFDGDGNPVGMTLRQVLEEVIGLQDAAQATGEVDVMNSYATQDGQVVRIRDAEVDSLDHAEAKRAWHILTSDGLSDVDDIDDIVLTRGSSVGLVLVTDADGDSVSRRLEYVYGTYDDESAVPSDVNITVLDSDGDGVGDYDEIFTPYRVFVDGESGYAVFSNPALFDSDGDGLNDREERGDGETEPTDPLLVDTDGDGACDGPGVAGCPVDHFPLDPNRSGRPPMLLELLFENANDNDDIAVDTSPASNHADVEGDLGLCGTTSEPDRFNSVNQAFSFDEGESGGDCGDEAGWVHLRVDDLGIGNTFAIAFWLLDEGTGGFVLGQAHDDDMGLEPAMGFSLELDELKFQALSESGSQKEVAIERPEEGEWAFYVANVAYDGTDTTMTLHKASNDGSEVELTSATTSFAGRLANPNEYPLLLGARSEESSGFQGGLDDVRVFDGVISTINIEEIYGQLLD